MRYWSALTLAAALAATPAALHAAPPQSLTGPPFVPRPNAMEFSGRLIAHLRPEPPRAGDNLAPPILQQATALLQPYKSELIPEVSELLVTVPPGENENSLATKLLASNLFDWVRPDWILYPAAVDPVTPNDPTFNLQWHLSQIQAPAAWAIQTGTPNVVIAIVDTGVDLTHPDLSLVLGYDSHFTQRRAQANGGTVSDCNGHGTSVAGVAAAVGNNGIGGCGVGWNLRIMPIRASNPSSCIGAASFSDLQNGALWASNNGAQIVNVSFTGVAEPVIEVLGATLRARGVLLIWPMDDNNVDYGTSFDHPDVTVVSGTDQNDIRYAQSSHGLGVDIAAPATSIWLPTLGGGYGYNTGNSFAAPQVAGAAAMVWGLAPALLPSEVEQILFDSADDIGPPGQDDDSGAGRLNLHTALWLTIIRGSTTGKQSVGYNAAAFSIDDLYDFTAHPIDVTGDGVIDQKDTQAVEGFFRTNEHKDMTRRRP